MGTDGAALEALAARLARALLQRPDGPVAPVLLLSPPGDPLGEYLRAGILALGGGVTEEAGRLSECRGLVLPRLTARTVCEVWAGTAREGESGALLRTLLEGKPAWTPEEGGFLAQLPQNALGIRIKERFYELCRAGLTVAPAQTVIRHAAGTREKKGRP